MLRGALVAVCNPSGQVLPHAGWMYLVPLVAFFVVRGRDYYLAPAYPMLLSAGAVVCRNLRQP